MPSVHHATVLNFVFMTPQLPLPCVFVLLDIMIMVLASYVMPVHLNVKPVLPIFIACHVTSVPNLEF